MTTLLTLQDAELAFGDQPLLDHANLTVMDGERIGVIGRNGTGKSSLLRVIAGADKLDDGSKTVMDGLGIAYVEQEPFLPEANTLRESLILRGKLNEENDEQIKWRQIARLDEYLHRFELDGDRPLQGASGGEKKRAALALAFTQNKDLLLLDEPTNHLDIDAILILEELIKSEYRGSKSLMVITHDRAFLDSVSTRIIELDRGVLRSYPGNFEAYENRKEQELAAEDIARRKFDKFWAQEEVWIRKGIEARRTRNEGRVRRLERLREERAARRDRLGQINLNIDAGMKSGKIVAELEKVSLAFGDKVIVKDLNFRLLRGDRLGLVGHNGVGKSTLISLILGKRQPDSGTIKLGTNLQIAYFDQLRAQLDPNKTVAETISPGSEWIEVGGSKKHIMAYLGDFLFPPRRANVPVSNLSGGERNRLLLARLFALPANLLVLDEPTNDLDIDSLELLEQTLQNYPGTLILVSHDRRFLDNVVTEVLAPEGNGLWREYVGGYSDWQHYKPKIESVVKKAETVDKVVSKKPKQTKIKLSYKENKELETLPEHLMQLEAERDELISSMNAPDYYTNHNAQEIKEQTELLQNLEAQINQGYQRWEELENKRTFIESTK
ncbi:ATP-binding cassette domain-containing protein [Parasutterella secunda]|uniref:ATP-binding cassette domain-containing protein n=1 Tax=Parasutterella secunda TaxID=626947 RepID=UPI0020127AE4|nr:ATP-binding cassette domain-containing protein [Parasutterella secunda]MCL1596062.1 ATP-binding cassette domain-containing protein [Parasutterella secunda]